MEQTPFGSVIEIEKRNRILVSLWAYAYEIMNDSLVSDAKFDDVCQSIRQEIKTDNKIMDNFFACEFSPHTGMWIYKHPMIDGIRTIYHRITGKIGERVNHAQSKPNVPIKNNMPFNTHFENMAYLASLGFHVVGGRYIGQNMVFDYEFDKDFITLTNIENKEQRMVAYKDLLHG